MLTDLGIINNHTFCTCGIAALASGPRDDTPSHTLDKRAPYSFADNRSHKQKSLRATWTMDRNLEFGHRNPYTDGITGEKKVITNSKNILDLFLITC